MTSPIDLDAYFQRIGYFGPRTTTLETLKAIHERHSETIPFENLNPLLRQSVRLDLPFLMEKLVFGGRGGYCFEHNLLFGQVVEELGFRKTGLAARVLWEGAVTPRTHMVLLISNGDESYLADVGFGGQTLTWPLRFISDIEQPTSHESFRLIQSGQEFELQAKILDNWKPLYRFDLQEQQVLDYEVYNWYTSSHPKSVFVNELMAARPAPGRRYALRNNRLTVHQLDGETQRQAITSLPEMRRILEEVFLIRLPQWPQLDSVLEKLLEGSIARSP